MGVLNKIKRWVHLWGSQFSVNRIENNHCDDNDTVLLIKLDAIGDFIIWLDSAKEYPKVFPDRKIVLLCNSLCKELAEATGLFQEILTLDIKKYENDFQYRVAQEKLLSERKFGLLVQTAFSRTQHMDYLAASVFAHQKIGFEADESKSNLSRSVVFKRNRRKLDQVYDRLIPASKDDLMEIQRNKEFIHGLGNNMFLSSLPKLPHIDSVNIPQQPYFVVFPGASTKVKMWNPDRFATVIEYVFEKTDYDCLVCGGKNETPLYDQISNRVGRSDRLKNYCGKTSLVDLIEVVRNAKFVLSNDTSGIHYAAGTGVKGICPFGEYNFGRFLPYETDTDKSRIAVCSPNMKCKNCSKSHMTLRCYWNILKNGRYLCLDNVTVDQVLDEVEKIV